MMNWKQRISRWGLVLFLMLGFMVMPSQLVHAEANESKDVSCNGLSFFSNFTTCLKKGYDWATFDGIIDPIRGLYGRTKETITGNSYKEELIQKHQANQQKDQEQTRGKTLLDFLVFSIQTAKKVGNVALFYNEYPLSHYNLDLYLKDTSFWEIEERVIQSVHYTLHLFTNMIWLLIVFASRLVVWMLEAALQTDLIGHFAEVIGGGIRTFAGLDGTTLTHWGMWGLLLPTMIVLLGAWVGWKSVAEGDSEGAQRGLIHSIMVIFLSFTFFYYAGDIAKKTNEITSGITAGLMGVTTNLLQPSQEALTPEETVAKAGNNLWQMLVYKPYLLMQYGTTQIENDRTEKLLKESPFGDKRKRVVEQEVAANNNAAMQPLNSVIRAMFLPLLALGNLLISLMVIFLTGAFLVYQLYFLMAFLLAPLALIWAVLPTWQQAAYRWLSEVLGALLMKLGIGVFLAMYFSFSAALYDYSSQHYLLTVLLQMVLVVLMVFQAKRIFSFVLIPAQSLSGKLGGSIASRHFLRYTQNTYNTRGGKCCCCKDKQSGASDEGWRNDHEDADPASWHEPDVSLSFPDAEDKDDPQQILIPLLLHDEEEKKETEGTYDSNDGKKDDGFMEGSNSTSDLSIPFLVNDE